MDRIDIANNISTNIERERVRLGMTQSQFAKELDMSLSSYKRIVSGETSRIDIYTAYLIYRLTGRFACEIAGFDDDVITLLKKFKKLSPYQKNYMNAMMDAELAFSMNSEKAWQKAPDEDLISVLIPTGNMADGMILDSCNVEKFDVSEYRKAFGNTIHMGIRITSNHLHPVYNKDDILLISRGPIRDGDTGIFINTHNKCAYIRKFKQTNPCELLPINNYGETFYVDSDDINDMSHWIKFGYVLCKVR